MNENVLYFGRATRVPREDPARRRARNRNSNESGRNEVNGFSSFFDFSPQARSVYRASASIGTATRTHSLNPTPHSDVRRRPRPIADGHRRRVVCSCLSSSLSRVTTPDSRVVAGSQRGAERDGVVPRLPLTLQLHAYLLTLSSASRLRR